MRIFFSIVFCFITLTGYTQQPQAERFTYRNSHFFYASNPANSKLIIFLHGGVSNPYFKQPADQIALDELLEHNPVFLREALANEFDVLIPVTNDSLDWLNDPQQAFALFQGWVGSQSKSYRTIYISGFSDGGTGSYKIFYTHPDFFNGLLVFNGYPQHQNFYKKVRYGEIRNKPILFFGCYEDEVIPYEFLLTEYCTQKSVNPNTYIYLSKGNHSFHHHGEQAMREVFDILSGKAMNTETKTIQGYVRNDAVKTWYPFRKRIVKNYNFGKEVYEENRLQQQQYGKDR